MSATGIEWTDRTWNPVRGCSRVSEGCRNCYAERQAGRFRGVGEAFENFVDHKNGHAAWTGRVELIESKLREPLHWRKPCRGFVNSMSDLFHESLPDEAIDRVFAVMALCPHITFQVLTKRPERMRKWATRANRGAFIFDAALLVAEGTRMELCVYPTVRSDRWPLPNVWLGVSVESPKHKDRFDILREVPAALRFLSLEPLLEDLGTLDLRGLDWIIVGGESGPGARPFDIAWARNTVQQCKAAGVAVFMKQFGTRPVAAIADATNTGMILDRKGSGGKWNVRLKDRKGGDPSEWPEWARVREFPR